MNEAKIKEITNKYFDFYINKNKIEKKYYEDFFDKFYFDFDYLNEKKLLNIYLGCIWTKIYEIIEKEKKDLLYLLNSAQKKININNKIILGFFFHDFLKKINSKKQNFLIGKNQIAKEEIKFFLFTFLVSFYQEIINKEYEQFINILIDNNRQKIDKYLNTLIISSLIKDFNNEKNKWNFNILNNFEDIPNNIKLFSIYLFKNKNASFEYYLNYLKNLEITLKNSDNKNIDFTIEELENIGKKEVKQKFFTEINIFDDQNQNVLKDIIEYYFNFQFISNFKDNQKFVKLFCLIIGYLKFKNKENEIIIIFENYYQNKKIKFNSSLSEINNIVLANKDQELKIVLEILEIENNKSRNIPKYILDWQNNKEILKEKSKKFIQEHFLGLCLNFLKKYYQNDFDKNNLIKLLDKENNIFWRRCFAIMLENWNNIKNNNFDNLIYQYIYVKEMNLSSSSKKEIIDWKLNYELNIKINEIIKDSFDKLKIFNLSKKYLVQYKDYIDINNLNPIVFVDNNLLSPSSRVIFSKNEQKGDKLYQIIIYILILEAKIEYKPEDLYCSASFQEKLSESLNLEKIIQSNNLHFGKEDSYSKADYFEALLYEVFKQKGIEKTIDFVFCLFKDNKEIFLIKNEQYKQIRENKNYFKNNIKWQQQFNIYTPEVIYLEEEQKKYWKNLNYLLEKLFDSFLIFYFLEKHQKPLYFFRKEKIWFIHEQEKINFYWNFYSLLKQDFVKLEKNIVDVIDDMMIERKIDKEI